MRIAIVDGQGGGIGCALIDRLKEKGHTLVALGTNAAATTAMLRAGANEGATGENAICFSAAQCDVIAGPIGIIVANSLLGEVSEKIAVAIGSARAVKVLVPSNRCNLEVAGTQAMSQAQYVDDAVARVLALAIRQ